MTAIIANTTPPNSRVQNPVQRPSAKIMSAAPNAAHGRNGRPDRTTLAAAPMVVPFIYDNTTAV